MNELKKTTITLNKEYQHEAIRNDTRFVSPDGKKNYLFTLIPKNDFLDFIRYCGILVVQEPPYMGKKKTIRFSIPIYKPMLGADATVENVLDGYRAVVVARSKTDGRQLFFASLNEEEARETYKYVKKKLIESGYEIRKRECGNLPENEVELIDCIEWADPKMNLTNHGVVCP